MTLANHQETGFVAGLESKSLAEANDKIAAARKLTPDHFRPHFRSYVRSLRGPDKGYSWGWVLK